MAMPNALTTQSLPGKQPGFFKGRGAQVASMNKYSPEAQSALSFLTNQGQQNLMNPYQGFEPIENQARSMFHSKTVPSIAERFAGSGSNALSSGAFASQVGEAGSGLEQAIAAMKAQYGLQNRGQSLQELLAGITPQYENFYQPREGSGFENLLQSLFSGGGKEGQSPIASILALLMAA